MAKIAKDRKRISFREPLSLDVSLVDLQQTSGSLDLLHILQHNTAELDKKLSCSILSLWTAIKGYLFKFGLLAPLSERCSSGEVVQ